MSKTRQGRFPQSSQRLHPTTQYTRRDKAPGDNTICWEDNIKVAIIPLFYQHLAEAMWNCTNRHSGDCQISGWKQMTQTPQRHQHQHPALNEVNPHQQLPASDSMGFTQKHMSADLLCPLYVHLVHKRSTYVHTCVYGSMQYTGSIQKM